MGNALQFYLQSATVQKYKTVVTEVSLSTALDVHQPINDGASDAK